MRRGADRAARRVITLPWWVILLASPVAYAVIAHGLPLVVLKGTLGTAFAGAGWVLGVFAAAGIAVFATLSALHQWRARRLFDQPLPSPRPAQLSAPACPQCGQPMVFRTAQRGARAGSRFWGCSRYPSCRGTVEV